MLVFLLAAVVGLAGTLLAPGAWAEEPSDAAGWRRLESRCCTIWLDPGLSVARLNRKLSTWMVRPSVRADRPDDSDAALAAKFDTLFSRVQELLEMRPAETRVTVRVARSLSEIQDVHAARYGYRAGNLAFYVLETNTIYAAAEDLTAPILAHEMAHCLIDHHFQVRPPKTVEELLATYAEEHLRN